MNDSIGHRNSMLAWAQDWTTHPYHFRWEFLPKLVLLGGGGGNKRPRTHRNQQRATRGYTKGNNQKFPAKLNAYVAI